MSGLTIKRHSASLLIAAIATICALWIGAASDFAGLFRPLSQIDGSLYDAAVGAIGRWTAQRHWRHTVVVLVDQKTLASPGWATTPRALQQPQLGQLGREILELGARKVGFDLVFAFDPADMTPRIALNTDYDAPLVDLFKRHAGDIVLGADASVGPAPRYAALFEPAQIGVIDLQTEDDGTVRSVATRLRLANGARALSFSNALAGEASNAEAGASRVLLFPPAPIGQVPHLSAADVETCLASPAGRTELAHLFAGRTVIVGAGLIGEDEHRGPDRFLGSAKAADTMAAACAFPTDVQLGRAAGRVPGAFLQAAAVESFLASRPIRLADLQTRVIANLVIAALGLGLRRIVRRTAALPARRGWLLGSTIRAALALLAAVVLLALVAVAFEAASLIGAATWVPIGPMATTMVVLCAAEALVSAFRRDMALADLRVTFGRWLPRPVVEAALEGGRELMNGQERTITVLIADLKDFTSFCASHRTNPELIVAALNRRFTAAQIAIDRHGGCIDKFMGDAVIAFWNGVEAQDDHALRAIAAASDIIGADQQDGAQELKFKCAVATGIAFVGRYGSVEKSNFSAIGEPMNLAARLEALCRVKGLDIIVAESTAQAVSATKHRRGYEAFVTEKAGEANLKGFPALMTYYTVRHRPGDKDADIVADLSRPHLTALDG